MANRPARFALLLVALLLVGACGSTTTTPTPAPSVATPSVGPSASPTGPTPAPTTVGPSAVPSPSADATTVLPAGVQFDPGATMPAGFSGHLLERDGTTIFLGTKARLPAVATRQGDSWKVVEIDDLKGYRLPAHFAFATGRAGWTPASVASGPTGVVYAATGTALDKAHGDRALAEGLLWSSPNGVSWRRFDPRTLFAGTASSVQIRSVAATDTGFLAIGSVAAADRSGPSEAVVLRSADGVTWYSAHGSRHAGRSRPTPSTSTGRG